MRMPRPDQRILRIPGDAYISSWRWPLRNRYSTAPKSFLFTEICFWNSALNRMLVDPVGFPRGKGEEQKAEDLPSIAAEIVL